MNLSKEVQKIQNRNARVEADKAWETSWTRRLILALTTYIVAAVLLVWIRAEQPFLAALVPTAGFILSTLTLPVFKSWWLEKRNEKKS